jgi:hypothetical protein
MLERDFVVAEATPERRMLGLFRKPDGELIGVLDWERGTSDGKPFIGLLTIRADQQWQRFRTQAFEGLAQQLRAAGNTVVGAGVIERNAVGRALAERLGFKPIATTVVRMASRERVIVLERILQRRAPCCAMSSARSTMGS